MVGYRLFIAHDTHQTYAINLYEQNLQRALPVRSCFLSLYYVIPRSQQGRQCEFKSGVVRVLVSACSALLESRLCVGVCLCLAGTLSYILIYVLTENSCRQAFCCCCRWWWCCNCYADFAPDTAKSEERDGGQQSLVGPVVGSIVGVGLLLTISITAAIW